ncbi:MAG: hypothetical protein Q4E59_00995 [Bacteroidales bacterium]|nr:hypothetical protein [Bacteroidales bacterium]
MKTFQYNINGKALTIRLDENRATVAELLVDGQRPEVTDAEMPAYAAVIALALIEHDVEVVHDEEPGVITLDSKATGWNNPVHLMTQNI